MDYGYRANATDRQVSQGRKLIFSTLRVAGLVFFSIFIIVYFCLPYYAEKTLLPGLAGSAGVSGFSCDVRRIGMTGADLGSLKFGESAQQPAFRMESLRVDYSPLKLINRQVNRIVLSGVQVKVEYNGNRFILAGLDITPSVYENRQNHSPDLFSLPFSFETLEIRDAVLVCLFNKREFRLPVEIHVTPAAGILNGFQCDVRLFPRGLEVHLAITIDTAQEKFYAAFDASRVQLERFADLCTMIPDLSLAGNVGIAGKAEFSVSPFEISSLSAECEFTEADFAVKGFEIRNAADQVRGLRPVRLTLNKKGRDQYLVNLSGFDIMSPIPVQDLNFTADLRITPPGVEGVGEIRALVEKSNIAPDFPELEHDIPVNIILRGEYTQDGWTFHAATKEPDSSGLALETGGVRLESGSAQFEISGKGSGTDGSAEYVVRLPELHAKTDSLKVALPWVSLTGHVNDFSENLSMDGTILFSGGAIFDKKGKIAISGISGKIPLKWPCPDSGPRGEFLAESVKINKMQLGTGTVAVRQKGMGIDFEIPKYTPASPIDLGVFLPDAAGFSVHGVFEGASTLSYSNSGFKWSMDTALHRGKILSLKQGMQVTGIDVSLAIPDLFTLQSAPGQQLTFEKARMGKIEINGGAIDFQFESGGSLFVEKGVFNWCNGRIHTQALRISPLKKDYNLTLFCDRLDLAMLLEQLGSVQAEGDCTVNGRIPLRWNRGRISFNDGFLFSTPGKGGKIRLFDTEILTAGIPPDSVQFAQLDLAREALKDYDYKWTKLGLSTEDEILVMQLKLDGSPAGPLPFVYSEEFGGFARVEADGSGSNFQGIGLDVNFRLPLNRILHYGKGLSDVMKMMDGGSD